MTGTWSNPLWFLHCLHSRWLNKLGLASIQYEPADRNHPVGENRPLSYPLPSLSKSSLGNKCFFPPLREECYSEASDHEEAESTDLPPPPYCEQTLRDSMAASEPPGSTNQVSGCYCPVSNTHFLMKVNVTVASCLCAGHTSPTLLLVPPWRRQWLAVLPRQHHDFTELLLLLHGQAAAVLAGPGLAGDGVAPFLC